MINHNTLETLSNILNENRITWGVGGSYLLQLYNLYSEPSDLDLWIQPSDMHQIKQIFKDFKEIPTNIPLPKQYHFKIMFIDTEVDFIACFMTQPNQYKFVYKIETDNIHLIDYDGIQVPCTFLEDWYIIYRLLNKDDKANLIQHFFMENNIVMDEGVVQRAITKQSCIPIRIKDDVRKLSFSAPQFSFFNSHVKEG